MKSTCICNAIVTLALAFISSVGWTQVSSPNGMVASDHPLASKVGAKVLEDGGNAVDAGVATLLTLGLLNPFASGLGGGGFCVVRAAAGESAVLDFREVAPAAARHDMYVVDGVVDRKLSVEGGLAVGVPGEAAGLHALHQKFGKMTWAKVVKPATVLARDGFEVGELLPGRLAQKAESMARHPELLALYTDNGKPVVAGKRHKNPALAKFLQAYSKQGPSAFYEGKAAQELVDAVVATGGVLTLDDLKAYEPTWRVPLKGTYRGLEILTMPPPSSGGTALLEILNILEGYQLPGFGYGVESNTVIIEAFKHAFADRARWLGDADFVEVPVQKLISKSYADELRLRIRPWTVGALESYGTTAPGPDDSGTSHISIIDRDGNMLACTSTVNTSFGSMVAVPSLGIVLNNQMDDFSAQPGVPNAYGLVGNEQNAIAAGKRPLSSMSPTLILKSGKPFMAVGASGGPTIISGTLQTILRIVDFGMAPFEAVSEPRLHAQWMPDLVFIEAISDTDAAILEKRGHKLKISPGFTAVQVVVKRDGVYQGASDPRKKGLPAAPTH